MTKQQVVYKKSSPLIIFFFILISILFIIALFIAYNLNRRYVKNEFESRKIDVFEQSIKPYFDLFQNTIPQITSYQGFLDSASASKYADAVFHKYGFVKRLYFYDMLIGNQPKSLIIKNRLGISLQALYEYKLKKGAVEATRLKNITDDADFKLMAMKLGRYITFSDTTRNSSQSEIFKTFYDVKPEKINYSNILRREDIKNIREMELGNIAASFYKQSMLSFFLDPYALKIKNTHPRLYQHIAIQPVVYYPLDLHNGTLVTEIALPGAFSDFKLFFKSEPNYLKAQINRRFMPIAALVLLIYGFLVLIGWLIYRNLNFNIRLFKLQYDFINNFTHEFKTPVSVIKIAGSNLSGDNGISERQRKQYGKILNEEADKLNELMNKLLSFTQIENRSILMKREAINVQAFAEQYAATFKIKYPDFHIEQSVEDFNEFFTDPVLLGSVFQNLIENSYKYSTADRKYLFIKIYHDKKRIIFSFKDQGIGIPKSELSNIFEKFYRIENKYNQNGSVGLGLAFCKELVNFMGGDIYVNSKINEGSEFVVTLPFEN